MPEQANPAAARESIKAMRIHPSRTDLRYQSALQRYIAALSPTRDTEEQATRGTWFWNAVGSARDTGSDRCGDGGRSHDG
jgi:hypothetical protein